MKTITKENAETKMEISALIYANKLNDFHSFTALVEEMLDKYARLQAKNISSNPPVRKCTRHPNKYFVDSMVGGYYFCPDCNHSV